MNKKVVSTKKTNIIPNSKKNHIQNNKNGSNIPLLERTDQGGRLKKNNYKKYSPKSGKKTEVVKNQLNTKNNLQIINDGQEMKTDDCYRLQTNNRIGENGDIVNVKNNKSIPPSQVHTKVQPTKLVRALMLEDSSNDDSESSKSIETDTSTFIEKKPKVASEDNEIKSTLQQICMQTSAQAKSELTKINLYDTEKNKVFIPSMKVENQDRLTKKKLISIQENDLTTAEVRTSTRENSVVLTKKKKLIYIKPPSDDQDSDDETTAAPSKCFSKTEKCKDVTNSALDHGLLMKFKNYFRLPELFPKKTNKGLHETEINEITTTGQSTGHYFTFLWWKNWIFNEKGSYFGKKTFYSCFVSFLLILQTLLFAFKVEDYFHLCNFPFYYSPDWMYQDV